MYVSKLAHHYHFQRQKKHVADLKLACLKAFNSRGNINILKLKIINAKIIATIRSAVFECQILYSHNSSVIKILIMCSRVVFKRIVQCRTYSRSLNNKNGFIHNNIRNFSLSRTTVRLTSRFWKVCASSQHI